MHKTLVVRRETRDVRNFFSSLRPQVSGLVEAVFKTCEQVGKTLRCLHNVVFTNFAAVLKNGFLAQLSHVLYVEFHTAKMVVLHLLNNGFSTQSTMLITETTGLNKSLILMESV